MTLAVFILTLQFLVDVKGEDCSPPFEVVCNATYYQNAFEYNNLCLTPAQYVTFNISNDFFLALFVDYLNTIQISMINPIVLSIDTNATFDFELLSGVYGSQVIFVSDLTTNTNSEVSFYTIGGTSLSIITSSFIAKTNITLTTQLSCNKGTFAGSSSIFDIKSVVFSELSLLSLNSSELTGSDLLLWASSAQFTSSRIVFSSVLLVASNMIFFQNSNIHADALSLDRDSFMEINGESRVYIESVNITGELRDYSTYPIVLGQTCGECSTEIDQVVIKCGEQTVKYGKPVFVQYTGNVHIGSILFVNIINCVDLFSFPTNITTGFLNENIQIINEGKTVRYCKNTFDKNVICTLNGTKYYTDIGEQNNESYSFKYPHCPCFGDDCIIEVPLDFNSTFVEIGDHQINAVIRGNGNLDFSVPSQFEQKVTGEIKSLKIQCSITFKFVYDTESILLYETNNQFTQTIMIIKNGVKFTVKCICNNSLPTCSFKANDQLEIYHKDGFFNIGTNKFSVTMI
ncbi:hypothetical protein EIN_296450 [Entamoeba invadens IP1]|uniref:Uncharacterized protein n=1 Tax=Entamoeba invadens IP1 TaxID=370355 RepID=L7FKW0_ENTIV|nr:hypothetical protein EIN_296450 [Entamoeba invadens IP1]ELP86335.1 hypothetical protein EIN_296450 [Entamoeba invadens IP1]|eukprot:XP_004185681.1 hypothetical protein EIN_296450 [Entamoeba invadens IP1]